MQEDKVITMKLFRKLTTNSGVTLIELIAVLGIISIIFFITVPFYRQFRTSMVLKNTSKGIVSYIAEARSYAKNFNRDFEVNFDTTNHKLTITDSLPQGDQTDEDVIQYFDDLEIPRTFLLTTNADSNKLTIHPSGTTNACSIWINKGTKYHTVTVSSMGTLRIYNYNKN
ncbi:Tfp pilus assembly protein FimT/FimU [Candidatus Auribacterota bacterium]